MQNNTFSVEQLQVDAVSAGNRAAARWLRGKTTRFLIVTILATYTCTVAVTSIKGLGSIVQAFDEFGIDENGTATAVDPRLLLAASEALRASAATATRVTAVGTQTTSLREQLKIPFEMVWALGGGIPNETRFRERDPGLDTKFFYTLNNTSSGVDKIKTGGTAALTNVSVAVQQAFDDSEFAKNPLFKPGYRQLSIAVPSTSAALKLDLQLDSAVRAITILQDSDVGMVTDIISAFRLYGSRQAYLGKSGQLNWDQFSRSKEFDEGGNVYSSPGGGIVHHNFTEFGHLSNALTPMYDSNFQLELNATPSVTSGATNSRVLVLLHTLNRDPQKDIFLRKDKIWVVAPPQEFAARAPGLVG